MKITDSTCSHEDHQSEEIAVCCCEKCDAETSDTMVGQDSANITTPEEKQEKKTHIPKNKKKWILYGSLIFVVVLVAIAGFYTRGYLQNAKEEKEKPVVVKKTPEGYDTVTPFTVAIPSEGEFHPEGIYQKSLKRLEGLSDAPIEWIYLSKGNAMGAMRKKVSAEKYPDVVVGDYFSSDEILQYAEQGRLIPLEKYINEKDTPNLWRLCESRPEIMASGVTPDGHMYTLPRIQEFGPDYMQSILWINQTWLNRLGLNVPTTLEELKYVLRAFKEGDPNGNGVEDEIPLSFQAKSPDSYPEMLLSCWGTSALRGAEDGWLSVQNGQVNFAPTTEEWKSMIIYYKELYEEGLLDPETFSQKADEFDEKLLSPVSTIGLTWSLEKTMSNPEEYVAISPLRASYRVRPAWRIHPKFKGKKEYFCIFESCENPGAAMRWIDKFYDFDNTIQNFFGEYGYAVSRNEEDRVIWNPSPEEEETVDNYFQRCVLLSGMPGAILKEDYETTLDLIPSQQEKMDDFRKYEEYLDDEVWIRPYYTEEEEAVLSNLRGDISELVSAKMTAWITGAENLEADWEQYLSDLEQMGLSEMMEVYRTAYGRYQTAMDEIILK